MLFGYKLDIKQEGNTKTHKSPVSGNFLCTYVRDRFGNPTQR
jgi:hypothetical protein